MDKNDSSLFAKRFGVIGKVVFLIEGSHAAEFSKVIQVLLEKYSIEELGQNNFERLINLQVRLDQLFEVYHQNYIKNPDEVERVHLYRKNIEELSTLAGKFKEFLMELRQTDQEKKYETIELIVPTEKIIDGVIEKHNKMQIEFPE